MTNHQDDMLVFVDLETTGLDPDLDEIIEIAAILTTTDLAVIGMFESTVQPSAEGLGRLLLNPVVYAMHTENGLLDTLAEDHIPPIEEVARVFLEWLDTGPQPEGEGRLVLAGSGVASFDRKFLARYMPEVTDRLRYWSIDVGVIRRAHQMWSPHPAPGPGLNELKTHRAMDDVRLHLAEARAYRDYWSAR